VVDLEGFIVGHVFDLDLVVDIFCHLGVFI
jgi:hypothetical protein